MTCFHRLLRIDLTHHTATVEEIPTDVIDAFVGGKGLGTYYLYREVAPQVDPLGPENKVFIAPGALCGTLTPAASRYEMVTKSPLTGIYLGRYYHLRGWDARGLPTAETWKRLGLSALVGQKPGF